MAPHLRKHVHIFTNWQITAVLPRLTLGQTEGAPLYAEMFQSPTANSYIYVNGGLVSGPDGAVYGCNYFQNGPISMGGFTVTPPQSGRGFFVYRLEADGTIGWLVSPRGTASFMDCNDIEINSSGTAIGIVGSFLQGTIIIANETFTWTGTNTIRFQPFLMLMDTATGAQLWGKTWGGNGAIGSWAVGFDSAENILFNGRFSDGTMIVNGQTYDAGSFNYDNYCMKVCTRSMH